MDRRALVIGATGGIGRALAKALRHRGVHVTALSRKVDGLDITSEADIVRVFKGLAGQSFDLVIIASGILAHDTGPEKTIGAVSADEMAALYAVNAIGPALILKHLRRFLPKDQRSVVAVLSARVGSIGDNRLGGWYSYRASKAALNQIVRTASIEMNRTHKRLICVAMHPGTVQTEFTENFPHHTKVAPQEAAENLLAVIDGLSSSDTGQFFDWAGQPVAW